MISNISGMGLFLLSFISVKTALGCERVSSNSHVYGSVLPFAS